MQPDIESQLKLLPRFPADDLFKDKLKQQLLRETHRLTPVSWLPRLATIMIALLIVIGGVSYYRKIQTPSETGEKAALELFRVAPASAAELIVRHVEKFLAQGTIYHEKSRYYIDNTEPIIYDVWEDTVSDRFNNKADYPDGRKVWQGFNLDFRWDVDYQSKTVRKDIYIWHSDEDKNKRHGTQVSLADKFQGLLQQGILSLSEEQLHDKAVYVIVDSRRDPDKYWDKLYFDKETFQLLQTEITNPDGTFARLVYDIQEALPRSEENLTTLFSFTSPGSEFVILERHFDTRGGYVESDYYPVGQPPSATAIPTVVPSLVPNPAATPSASLTPPPSSTSQP